MTSAKNTLPSDENLLLTSKEVAALLKIQVKSLANQRNKYKSQIPFIRISKTAVRYKLADVLNFLNKNTVVQS